MLPNLNRRNFDKYNYLVPYIAATIFVFGAIIISRKKRPSYSSRLADSKGLQNFVPTDEWQVVQKYHICPPGLKYKMDVNTGVTLARK